MSSYPMLEITPRRMRMVRRGLFSPRNPQDEPVGRSPIMSFANIVRTPLVLLVAAVPALAAAHGYVRGPLKIDHPWARPAPAGAPAAGGYLTIANTGDKPDRLVSASTPDAAKVELHEMIMQGDVMLMRPLKGGLVIPPGQTVELKPGGRHVMFIGPKAPFALGRHVPVTLRFERAGEVRVQFFVETPPSDGADHHGMDMH